MMASRNTQLRTHWLWLCIGFLLYFVDGALSAKVSQEKIDALKAKLNEVENNQPIDVDGLKVILAGNNAPATTTTEAPETTTEKQKKNKDKKNKDKNNIPDYPDLELIQGFHFGDEVSLCADVVIVLDISCSISKKMRRRIRDTATMVVEAVLENPMNDMKIGLISYSKDIHHILYLNNTLDPDDLIEAIRTSPIKGSACRTQTNDALDDAYKNFFQVRETPSLRSQILYLFTDGFTYKRELIPDTVAKAEVLKDSGVVLNVIKVPHKHGKTDTDEFETLPSTNRLFNIESDMVAVEIYEVMSADAFCDYPFYGSY